MIARFRPLVAYFSLLMLTACSTARAAEATPTLFLLPTPTWTPYVLEVTPTGLVSQTLPTATPPAQAPLATQQPPELPSPTPTFSIPFADQQGQAEAQRPAHGSGDISQAEVLAVRVAQGLFQPVNIINAGDGSGRLFVIERAGRVFIIQDGQLLPEPFLDYEGPVTSGSGHQGMWGLAFHPDYETNGEFFVSYTEDSGDLVIERLKVSADNPNRASTQSHGILLRQDIPHQKQQGGYIAFGPDGYLYIAIGDGDPNVQAEGVKSQQGLTFLGKLLRIDVDCTQGDLNYCIPPNNPFVGRGDILGEIWAMGLRMPAAFSFDAPSGQMYITDIGSLGFEEVNVVPIGDGGYNFGWPMFEGSECGPAEKRGDLPCTGDGLTFPVAGFKQENDLGDVVGGHVYRGALFPDFYGAYIFGDVYRGQIWALTREGDAWNTTYVGNIAQFNSMIGQAEDGELYIAAFKRGEVYHLTDPNP